MAQAIRKIVEHTSTREEAAREAKTQMDAALFENAGSIVELLRLVRQLDEKDFLGMASAILENGTPILEIIVNQANRPQYATGLKNAMGLVALLGRLDVSMLSGVLDAASQATQRVQQGEGTDVGGVFKLLGALRDPDVTAGLSFMMEILKSVGGQIRQGANDAKPQHTM